MKDERLQKRIGRALQARRKAAGYESAAAFAPVVGLTVRAYTSYEQGAHPFDIVTAWTMADALGCTLDELAGREVPQPSYADQRQAAMNRIFAGMNDAGKTKAVDNVRDLAGNPAYQEGSKSGVDAAEIWA